MKQARGSVTLRGSQLQVSELLCHCRLWGWRGDGQQQYFVTGVGAVVQLVAHATPVEEIVGLIPAMVARSLLVGSVLV